MTKHVEILEERLHEKGWAHKTPRYADVLDRIEYLHEVPSPSVSIIVISWRLHPDNLKNFEILDTQRSQNYELIFVDNGATENEFAPLKPFIDTYIHLRTNTGAYLARNIGAVFAHAPILIFLEDDGIPEGNFVEAHLDMYRKYEVIAVRGVCRPKTDTIINRMAPHYFLGDVPFPSPGNLEGNTSFTAGPFFAVGGWDDDIVFGGGGNDLAIRLLGVEPDPRKQIYAPGPVIYHDYAMNTEHLAAKRKKQEASILRLRAKHPDWDAVIGAWKRYARRYDLLIPKELPYDAGLVEGLLRKGSHAEALSYLEKVLAKMPEEARIHTILGVVHAKGGQSGKALEHLLKAVKLEPHNATYQKNLAGLFLKDQRLREAFDLYETIVRLYPEDTDSLMALAHMYCLFGHLEDALLLWKAVLLVDPNHKSARQKLQEHDMDHGAEADGSKPNAQAVTGMVAKTRCMLSDALASYEGGHVEKAETLLGECILMLKEAAA